MSPLPPYDHDLAYVHDQGFGEFARGAAPGVVTLLRDAGMVAGRVVDLGCGSGIFAQALAEAGYDVVGVDISPAMIEIARSRVPTGAFLACSFREFEIPPAGAVTALGEVFNYLFDGGPSLASLTEVCRKIHQSLSQGGRLVFDAAEPGRCRGMKQGFKEGADWTCLVEYQHDTAADQLTRRIVTFRRVGELYRRSVEVHRQQLFSESAVVEMLRGIGFRVESQRSYGDWPLSDGVVAYVAAKA